MSSNAKRMYTGGGSKDRQQRQNIGTLPGHVRIGTKTQVLLILVMDIKGNKSLYCYVIGKRVNKENVGPLLNVVVDLVTVEADEV